MLTTEVNGIPVPTLRRLPSYLQFIRQLASTGRDVVSCTHIADHLRLDATLVRKDLQTTGIVGKPKVGYYIPALIEAIEHLLGWDNATDAFLVGAGNLGAALLGYEGFREHGLNIVAAFDVNPQKVGLTLHDKQVLHLDHFADLTARMHIHIGIITVPEQYAQEVADLMVLSGIKAIWNFAPTDVRVPPEIIIENVRLSASLAVLSPRLAAALRAGQN
jgi:redox-sensing transcriptional repressor